jgi:NAD+ synthase (glutamine-hydrolysing)
VTTNFTLALAQMQPKLADISANLQMHLDTIRQAADAGVELVIFPELSLTGYYLRDLVPEVGMTLNDAPLQQIMALSAELGVDVIVGFVEETTRKNYYIAAAYIECGEVRHVHHKVYLPTYGQFDDGRFFKAGEHIRAFDTRFGRVGMLICEDFWHISASYLLWMDGAELMYFHSASPGRGLDQHDSLGTQRNVNSYMQVYSRLYTTYVAHCNRVGFEAGEVFWGGSSVFDPSGEQVKAAPAFDEALVLENIDLRALRRSRSITETLRDERLDLTLRELSRIQQRSLQTTFDALPTEN